MARHAPAVDVRQPDIECDGMRTELARQGDGRHAAPGNERLEATGVSGVDEDAGKRGVVLHEEEHAVARLDVEAVVGQLVLRHRPSRRLRGRGPLGHDRARRAGGLPLWDVELERATPARRAHDRALAPPPPGDLSADGEPEPRAAVPPARAALGLLEGLEDDLVLLRRDADAR